LLSLHGEVASKEHASMHEGGYFTYIMASRSHTLYIGVSGDLHKRRLYRTMQLRSPCMV
jgi:predicted GIY-YIG superfamily endonuclease